MQKLSGNAKFELDTKINRFQFFNMLEYMATDSVSANEGIAVASSGTAPEAEQSKEVVNAEGSVEGALATEGDDVKVFNEAKYIKISEIWQTALSSESSGPPFVGDLNDPSYVEIINRLKSFKPGDYVEEPAAQE